MWWNEKELNIMIRLINDSFNELGWLIIHRGTPLISQICPWSVRSVLTQSLMWVTFQITEFNVISESDWALINRVELMKCIWCKAVMYWQTKLIIYLRMHFFIIIIVIRVWSSDTWWSARHSARTGFPQHHIWNTCPRISTGIISYIYFTFHHSWSYIMYYI